MGLRSLGLPGHCGTTALHAGSTTQSQMALQGSGSSGIGESASGDSSPCQSHELPKNHLVKPRHLTELGGNITWLLF